MAKTLKRAGAAERARAYIESILNDPSLLDESIAARRTYGPGCGYASLREWWEMVEAWYPERYDGILDGLEAPAFDEVSVPAGGIEASIEATLARLAG